MRRILFWIAKALLAGAAALFALSLPCLLYYNVGIRFPSKSGATDYAWGPNAFYSRGTEGFAFGWTDRNGYNDAWRGSADDAVDWLMMGSSHTEAFNVPQDENTVYRMNELLRQNNRDDLVYNIGVSGHTFLHCVKNLDRALSAFQPQKGVIIETPEVFFALAPMEEVLEGRMATIPSYATGLLFYLQKIPYLRLLYAQYQNMGGGKEGEAQVAHPELGGARAAYEAALNRLLERAKNTADAHRVDLTVVFHAPLALGRDGGAHSTADAENLRVMSELCARNGIRFIDLTAPFLRRYGEDRTLPHGFANSPSPGQGHLNAHGHEIAARALTDMILGRETAR